MKGLIYANSKIKYYEKQLLQNGFLLSLADTNSYEETIEQLINSRYISPDDRDKTIEQISLKKEAELERNLNDLKINLPSFHEDNEELADWFLMIKNLKSRNADAENIKIKFLKSKKGDVFGIYPIFAYYYAFLSELRNIRIILTGKKLGASEKEIKERLCITYV